MRLPLDSADGTCGCKHETRERRRRDGAPLSFGAQSLDRAIVLTAANSDTATVRDDCVAAAALTPRALMLTPDAQPIRLRAPDPHYHLAPEDRARVLPRFDADALERLLAMTRPDLR